MMSSLASVFVANANATPEKVVPYILISLAISEIVILTRTYEIYADDKLCLAPTAAINLGSTRPVISLDILRSTVCGIIASLLLSVAWGPRWRRSAVHLLWGVTCRLSVGIDRRRHGTMGPTGRMLPLLTSTLLRGI